MIFIFHLKNSKIINKTINKTIDMEFNGEGILLFQRKKPINFMFMQMMELELK